jgi:hypothetical protein
MVAMSFFLQAHPFLAWLMTGFPIMLFIVIANAKHPPLRW